MHFIYDTEAIALQYGYYSYIHNVLPDCRVMFLDVGYLHTSVFEVEYKQGSPFNILYCGNSTKCGGKVIDEVLVEHVMQILKTQYKIDEHTILNSPRDIIAIQNACEKAKWSFSTEVQEANISLSLTCCKDQDIWIDLPYETFLKLCSKVSIFETIRSLCQNCLTACEGADIILLEGSSSRFQEITHTINQIISSTTFKRTPRMKLVIGVFSYS